RREQKDGERDRQPEGRARDVERAFQRERPPSNVHALRENKLARSERADEELAGHALVEIDPLLDLDALEAELEELLGGKRSAPVRIGDDDETDVVERHDAPEVAVVADDVGVARGLVFANEDAREPKAEIVFALKNVGARPSQIARTED